jgi:hypothetical protein
VATALEGGSARAAAGGRSVSDVLEVWAEQRAQTWAAGTERDQRSRVRLIQEDPISKLAVARLSVADIERCHARLRRAGKGDAGIRNQHTVLQGCVDPGAPVGVGDDQPSVDGADAQLSHSAANFDVGRRRAEVIAATSDIDAAAGLALRLAAVAGARRAELAALRWVDVSGGMPTIDSAIGS